MDTLYYDVLKLGYHLGLAVIVGGGFTLGAAAAPAIFAAARSKGEGGTIFGGVLARFDGFAVLALIVVALTTVLKAVSFESADATTIARWVALAFMAAGTLYASLWAGPIARSLRAQTAAWEDLPETAPARREFSVLHARSRRAMSFAVLAGVVALFLS